MCHDDDDLGKTPGRAPIGQEELGFFSTLKVDEDDDEVPERRSGIAEPSASVWAEVDAQRSKPASGLRPGVVLWIVVISAVLILVCAGLLLAHAF
jgi:hypothetical protein